MRAAPFLITLVLLCRCGTDDKAEKLIARGEAAQAESLLRTEIAKHPSDLDLHFLLGRACVAQQKPECAAQEFSQLTGDEGWKPRIATAYRDALPQAAKLELDKAEAEFAVAAALLAPNDHAALCDHLIATARNRRAGGRAYTAVARATSRINAACGARMVSEIELWLRDGVKGRSDDAEHLADIALAIDGSRANDVAVVLRRIAIAVEPANQALAEKLLRKAIELSPELGGDLETLVLRDRLTPKEAPQSSRGPYEVSLLDRYRGTPLEATLRVMGELGRAILQYTTDYNRYPPGSIHELRNALAGYIADVPWVDGWGRGLLWVSDGQGGRLISGGADGVVSNASIRLESRGRGQVHDYAADIVWENGQFITLPTDEVVRPGGLPPTFRRR